MFLKQCKALNIDPFTEFIWIADSLWNPITAAYVDNDKNDSDDDENDTYI